MNIEEKHETFLYPIVRIFSDKAAGSGTIIYSQPDPKNEGEYLSFVLTNFHVIESLLSYKDDWDSLLKREIKKEFHNRAKVENFSYVFMSSVDSSNRHSAEIIAYDKHHDLAVLKIESPKKFDYVAKLIPKDNIRDLRLFMDVVVAGCSMAHEPFCNFGQLTFLKEMIDQKEYVMTNASSIFGNSGGALFLKETGELIGVPSRISAIQIGFGVDVITWMGFSCHPKRLYQFLKEQELQFIYDPKDDYYSALERRRNKETEALMALKAEFIKHGKEEVEAESNLIEDD